jgi:hypothetical protein
MGFNAATSWPGESFISSFMESCKKTTCPVVARQFLISLLF